MSDNNTTSGQRSTEKRIFGKFKDVESRELVLRTGDEIFVMIDGKMLPVDTSPSRGQGFRRYARGSKTGAGKLLSGGKKPQVQSLVARMYLGSSDAVEVLGVIAAYTALMRELGFGRIDVVSVEAGSVWTTIKQTYNKIVDNRKVRVAATQLVGFVEGASTEKFQADNTATHVNSVANMADKLKHMSTFSFDSGPLQYVQWEDENGKIHGMARVVASKDIAAKRLDDEIVRNPQKMLELLREQPDVITAPSED